MRKVGRFLLWALLCLVGIVVVSAGAVYGLSARKLSRRHTVFVAPMTIPISKGVAAHGQHLFATRGCADCHGADLGGAKVVDNPAVGRLYGPNLTRGEGSVTLAYQEEDWVRAIRHGLNPQGRPLVLMPSVEFAELSEQDLADLLAFITSAPPVNRASVPVSVGPVSRVMLLGGQMHLAADVIDHSGLKPSTVAPGATEEYGRYLAVGCQGCHGPNYSGGKIAAGPPDWPAASNLTSGAHGVLASWTEADFLTALRTGRRPNGSEISPVMPRAFGKMTDDELKALWSFLKTVPPAPTGTR
ncbi:c-type cytochrome [Verrucomicrobiota bacterium sgz303538]